MKVLAGELTRTLRSLRTLPRVGYGWFPVLRYAHLESDGYGSIHVTATNLDVTVRVGIGGSAQPHEDMLIPFDWARQLAGVPTAGEIELSVAESQVIARGGGLQLVAEAMDAQEFPPPLLSPVEFEAIEFDSKALTQIAQFVSSSDHPIYNCVCVERLDGVLSLVASDGHVLVTCAYEHEATCADEHDAEDRHNALIPAVAIRYLPLLGTGLLRATWGSENGSLETQSGAIHFRRINGTYPNWRKIVPSEDGVTGTITLETDALPALKMAAELVRKDSVHAVLVSVDPDGITLARPSGGSVHVPARVTGVVVDFGISVDYLRQIVQLGPGVKFDFVDRKSPLTFETTNGFWGMVMVAIFGGIDS